MVDPIALRGLAANMITELPSSAERARLRNLFGITQDELASTLKVSRRTVYAWERGNAEPTGRNRAHYAEVLALWSEREHASQSHDGTGAECFCGRTHDVAESLALNCARKPGHS